MPTIPFGKRQRFANISPDTLPERVVPAFDMRRFPRLFADAPMRFTGKHLRVGVPEIAETHASSVRRGNPTPQPSTRAGAPVANREGDDVACPAAQDHPEPPFPCPRSHKRPDFIQLQHIIREDGGQRLLQWGRPSTFFLSMPPAFSETRRRFGRCRACSTVPARREGFRPGAPGHRGVWASRRLPPDSLCIHIADCRYDFGHF